MMHTCTYMDACDGTGSHDTVQHVAHLWWNVRGWTRAGHCSGMGMELRVEGVIPKAISSLMYMAMQTCPDIAFAVQHSSQYTPQPAQEHWTTVKHILCYLKGTHNKGIIYTWAKIMPRLEIYSNADFANQIDAKSMSGCVCVVELVLHGVRRNKAWWHFWLWKLNILPWHMQLNKWYGSRGYYVNKIGLDQKIQHQSAVTI